MKYSSDKNIADLLKKSTIRIYTAQHPNILEQFNSSDFISGGSTYYEGFEESYKWMKSQMLERLEDYSGDFPIWAWSRRQNNKIIKKNNKKPTIRIIADIPKERILTSDFILWHQVLNGEHVLYEENEFEESFYDIAENKVLDSWTRIFDITRERTQKEKYWSGQRRIIQLCVDRIYKHEIVSIKHIL